MRNLLEFLIVPAILVAVMAAAQPGVAQDLKKITEFPPVQGYLGDRAPDGVWTEKYDERTYRFYSFSEMDLNYGETLVLDVTSYEYQPIIHLQNVKGEPIATGTPIPSWVDPQNGLMVYAAHLEYRSVYQGRLFVFLLHSSHHMSADQWGNPVTSQVSNVAQGTFYLSGSLWREPDAPTASTPSVSTPSGSGGTFDMQCTCLAGNGRTYRTDMGLCPSEPVSETDPAWCN